MSKLTDSIRVHTVDGAQIAYLKRSVKDYVRIEISSLGGWYGEKNDLAPMIALSLLDAGTTKRTKLQLRELLNTRNISISFSSSFDRWSVYGSCFPEDVPLFFRIAKEMLTQALLPKKDFTVLINKRVEQIRLDMHDNRSCIGRAIHSTFYNKNHPLYQEPFKEIIHKYETTTLSEVREWYSRIGMQKPIISIVGDVSEKNAVAHARAFLKSMPKSQASSLPIIPLSAPIKKKLEHQRIPLKDKSSIDVRLAHPLLLYNDHPSYIPLDVYLTMLGGGFASHLVQTLRDRDGLTYGVNAYVYAGRKYSGLLVASSMFAPENYERGLATLKKEINVFLKKKITPHDVAHAKENIINQHLFSTLSAGGALNQVQSVLENDRDISYLDTYIDKVNAVTLADVQEAAKFIQPDKLTEFSAGTFKK